MKKVTLILLFILICFGILAEDFQDAQKAIFSKLYNILTLNVFSYYNLSQYDTELKKKVFKKTEEYEQKLKELKNLKKEAFSKIYYLILSNGIKEDYNIDKSRFEIDFEMYGAGLGTFEAKYQKTKDKFYFPSLQFIEKKEPILPGAIYQYVILNVNEETALLIENNKKDFELLIFFKIKDPIEVKYKYRSHGGYGAGLYEMTEKIIPTYNCRLILRNKKTHEIVFDKYY